LFFQQTISDSVHEIRGELKKLTTGIFAKKYYEPSYNLASETIKDFENTSLKNAKNSEAKSKHKINRFMRKSAG
jgi:hypothetical protein